MDTQNTIQFLENLKGQYDSNAASVKIALDQLKGTLVTQATVLEEKYKDEVAALKSENASLKEVVTAKEEEIANKDSIIAEKDALIAAKEEEIKNLTKPVDEPVITE